MAKALNANCRKLRLTADRMLSYADRAEEDAKEQEHAGKQMLRTSPEIAMEYSQSCIALTQSALYYRRLSARLALFETRLRQSAMSAQVRNELFSSMGSLNVLEPSSKNGKPESVELFLQTFEAKLAETEKANAATMNALGGNAAAMAPREDVSNLMAQWCAEEAINVDESFPPAVRTAVDARTACEVQDIEARLPVAPSSNI